MSAASGTIGRAGPRRSVRFYGLAALLLASLMAVLVVWTLAGRDAASTLAPSDPPGVSVDRIEDPPGWRYGRGGELFPRPFAPIQSSSG